MVHAQFLVKGLIMARKKQTIKPIDSKILDKQEEIIADFVANKKIDKKVKEKVVKNLREDQDKYPETNFYKYKKVSKTKYDIAADVLGSDLIKGYKALGDLKKEYRNNFFDKGDRCPTCGRLLERHSKTEVCNADLDHFLPKSIYPQFALYPPNLIPICKDCNQVEKIDKDINLGFLKKAMQSIAPRNFELYKRVLYDFSTSKVTLSYDYNDELINLYGLQKRYSLIVSKFYNNLLNLIKYHNISTPEMLERFLENMLYSSFNEMNDTFSINNYPKLWNDFLDFVLYDYNNLTALWEELKEYNKLTYFLCN